MIEVLGGLPLSRRDHAALPEAGVDAGARQAALAACIDSVRARTRQFAKRQETWFRSLSECTLVPLSQEQSPAEIADRIVALAASSVP